MLNECMYVFSAGNKEIVKIIGKTNKYENSTYSPREYLGKYVGKQTKIKQNELRQSEWNHNICRNPKGEPSENLVKTNKTKESACPKQE